MSHDVFVSYNDLLVIKGALIKEASLQCGKKTSKAEKNKLKPELTYSSCWITFLKMVASKASLAEHLPKWEQWGVWKSVIKNVL